MKTITMKNEPVNRYKQSIRLEPKKNLQVYIQQSTFKKMLKKIETGMTLSQITEEALESYLD